MTFNSEDEKKRYMQEVIDRILYCQGFKEELDEIMKKHSIPKERKISHKAVDFNYDKK